MENNGTWYSPAKGTRQYAIREVVRYSFFMTIAFLAVYGPVFLEMILGF